MTRPKLLVIMLAAASLLVGSVPYGWAASSGSDTARGVAHYIMGVSHELQGSAGESVRAFEQAAAEDQGAYAPHFRLGTAYAVQGNAQAAIRELKKAAAIAPQDPRAHYYLALVYSALQDNARASAEYETILNDLSRQDPNNVDTMIALGQLYETMGDHDKAAAQYARALELAPSNTDVLDILGNYRLETGKRAEGKAYLRRCLAADPDQADCANSLAYANAEDGVELDEALALSERALDAVGDNAAYIDTHGWILYRQGKDVEALKDLLQANALLKDPEIQKHLAEVYQHLKCPRAADRYRPRDRRPGKK